MQESRSCDKAGLLTWPVMLLSLCILLVSVDLSAQQVEGDQAKSGPGLEPGSSKALVIYFSRTGNTEIMATEIATRYQADLVNITAEKYSDSFWGSIKANKDAWTEQRMSAIDPETVDMTDYQLVFLGSPIWWYRPAVPLWTFVGKNDFDGKRIVLFNTFNSKFKDEHIDEFKQLVTQKGGEFIDHISVRRGRVVNQIDSDELIGQIQQLLIEREKSWH